MFQEKSKQGKDGGRIEEIIFWHNHWKIRFVTLPQEIPDKMKFHPWNSETCVTPPGNSNAYIQDLRKFHMIFSWSPL